MGEKTQVEATTNKEKWKRNLIGILKEGKEKL